MMRCLTVLLKRGDLELEQHSAANTTTPIEPRVISKRYSVANNGGCDGLEVGAHHLSTHRIARERAARRRFDLGLGIEHAR